MILTAELALRPCYILSQGIVWNTFNCSREYLQYGQFWICFIQKNWGGLPQEKVSKNVKDHSLRWVKMLGKATGFRDSGVNQELVDIRDKPEIYLVCLTLNPQAVVSELHDSGLGSC